MRDLSHEEIDDHRTEESAEEPGPAHLHGLSLDRLRTFTRGASIDLGGFPRRSILPEMISCWFGLHGIPPRRRVLALGVA